MTHCKNCIHWVDECLDQIAKDGNSATHIFMGCRIHGPIEKIENHQDCARYVESANLYFQCNSCRISVPKVCVSLGECANCTDTDLFCIESCIGGDHRKYCTHFIRLHSEGIQLIDDKNQVFDLFPALGMPERKNDS
jgi:hypothetical protein